MKKENQKILYVNQEMYPYTTETPMAFDARHLSQFSQENEKEIRVFVPKYGIINERRSQLHEVIRLSGMNVIINDVDHPLILKVASLPAARMQIYFVDNEDFFAGKGHVDNTGRPYDDSDAKMIFLARGVIETTIKLNWAPDIIHCKGWFTSLLPLYLRRYYKNNPMYRDTKVVISLYNEAFRGRINKKITQKLRFDNIPVKDLARYDETHYLAMMKAAISLADGVILAEEGIDPELIAYAKRSRTPIMPFNSKETFFADCNNFYSEITSI